VAAEGCAEGEAEDGVHARAVLGLLPLALTLSLTITLTLTLILTLTLTLTLTLSLTLTRYARLGGGLSRATAAVALHRSG
jgi:hypothetical protein